MGLRAVKKAANQPDYDDPDFVRARAFICVQTLDACRARLTSQMSAASAVWKEKLSEVTKSYREIVRDADAKASTKIKAKSFDDVVRLLAERDKIAEEKAEDMKGRRERISLVDEADAEAKAYKPGDAKQTALFNEECAVQGMPWATDRGLGVIYTALQDLEQAGATLDDYQSALLLELAEASIGAVDLGLEAAAAIEDDGDVEDFEAEELDDLDDTEAPF